MRPFGRSFSVAVCTMLVVGASAISFSQASTAKLGALKPGYVRMPKISQKVLIQRAFRMSNS